MFKAIFLSSLFLLATTVSIYTLSVPGIDNTNINFSNYQHKKIFLVNTASGSNYISQLSELQQLYQQHSDSLVVIAFPSNSFGNEPKTNSEIKTFMQNNYGISFPIAAKSDVKGPAMNALYSWISDKNLNGTLNGKARSDFQKFLVDGTGLVVAVFDSSTSPISPVVQQAIHDY